MLRIFIISLLISLLVSYFVLVYLRKLSMWQPIKDYGPKAHLVKAGTPTMGGISFVLSFLVGVSFLLNTFSYEILYVVIAGLLCSLVGLVDDVVKIRNKTDGVKAKKKLFLQIMVSLFCLLLLFKLGIYNSEIFIPLIAKVDFHRIYSPFIVFLFVGCMNAVNITDGLDGLACGSAIIALLSLLAISLLQGEKEIAALILILIGVLVGFFYYNRYPAKMFMGDVGAMFLGGILTALSIVLKVEMLMPLICGIFLIDILSVIIQLTSYKLIKRRVFLMSPLHHHFELKGWREPSIVKLFWGIELGLSVLGVMLYKLG